MRLSCSDIIVICDRCIESLLGMEMKMRQNIWSFPWILLFFNLTIVNSQVLEYKIQENTHFVTPESALKNVSTVRSISDCLVKCQVVGCESVNFDEVTRECATFACVSTILSTDHDKVYASKKDQAEYHYNCLALKECEGQPTGVHTIKPEGWDETDVYCDMESQGGGWMALQRRVDDSVDFYRTFSEYENGFGDPNGNHWIGNKNLLAMTEHKPHQLLILLEDFDGEKRFAHYSDFYIDNLAGPYTIHLSGYSGDAGDSMAYHNGQAFSTWDNDNDAKSGEHCASKYKGGWWYNGCHSVNLNGLYLPGPLTGWNIARGMNWLDWRGHDYSMKETAMLIKPK